MSERPMADLLVYDALLEFGIGGGEYCAQIADLATVAGLSTSQTARSLQHLADAGQIEFTGRRRGQTTIWRRGPNALASGATGPRYAGSEESPTGISSEPRTNPVAADGRSRLDDGPPSSGSGDRQARQPDDEALIENSRVNAYAILDTLDRGDDLGPPDLDQGDCGECGKTANVRWSLGLFQLCRECRRRRARARAKTSGGRIAAKDPAAREADRTPPEDPLYDDEARELVHDLIAQTQLNRPDDPYDLLEEAPY